MPQKKHPCGTPAAARRHERALEYCEPCILAARNYNNQRYRDNLARLTIGPNGRPLATLTKTGRPVKHGLNCYTRHRCKCDEGIAAYKAYHHTPEARATKAEQTRQRRRIKAQQKWNQT